MALKRTSDSGLIGAALIGVGCGLTAIGIAMVIPACASWSLGFAEQALKKGKEGVSTAATALGDIAGKAQHHFGEAASKAKTQTAKAAGAVESAARSVREYAS
jgi:hypothetical protein